MQHLDEGTIHAMLDGELPFAERDAAEAHIAACAECDAAVAEARGFIAASSRILTALDSVPGGVMPAKERIAPGTFHTPPRFTMSRPWMAAAAVLVLSTVAVIALRPHSDVARLQVAQAPAERTATVMNPNAGPRAMDTALSGAPAPVAPAQSEPASGNVAAANAPAAQARTSAETSRSTDQTDKLKSRLEAERQATKVRNEVSASVTMADAAPASSSPESGGDARGFAKPEVPLAAPAPSKDLKEAAPRDSHAIAALAAKAPNAPRDSVAGRSAIVLGQVIITGEGATSKSKMLGSTVASNETPLFVSRTSSPEDGDTVVTTVYNVRGVPVTLTDRSTARDELRRVANSSLRDQVMAKAREDAPANSITWSDSTGRTRTLRGALTSAELVALRRKLFGATP